MSGVEKVWENISEENFDLFKNSFENFTIKFSVRSKETVIETNR